MGYSNTSHQYKLQYCKLPLLPCVFAFALSGFFLHQGVRMVVTMRGSPLKLGGADPEFQRSAQAAQKLKRAKDEKEFQERQAAYQAKEEAWKKMDKDLRTLFTDKLNRRMDWEPGLGPTRWLWPTARDHPRTWSMTARGELAGALLALFCALSVCLVVRFPCHRLPTFICANASIRAQRPAAIFYWTIRPSCTSTAGLAIPMVFRVPSALVHPKARQVRHIS